MLTFVFPCLIILLGLVGVFIQFLIDSLVPITIIAVVGASCLLTFWHVYDKD